ncbi:MAG TPA: type VI secretion system amidase effector protein Tae4 [Allosphingosinicella sp.]|nr:type VI secretion system amidase effector protein Tae4 [Allosphingosinicella sp.]
MASLDWRQVWAHHPAPVRPCDESFANQCAIRMGVALRGAGVDLSGFDGATCWFGHQPRHVLRAQELAEWLEAQAALVGPVDKKQHATSADYAGRPGIVFIKDGWPSGGDHIDIWNGMALKGGQLDWFERGEIWFWDLSEDDL